LDAYIEYLGEIVGMTAIIPFMFVVAILGPYIVYKILHSDVSAKVHFLKWLVAVLTFFSCLILCVGTGGFIGSKFGFSALGMGTGLLAFYFIFDAFTGLLPSTCEIEHK